MTEEIHPPISSQPALQIPPSPHTVPPSEGVVWNGWDAWIMLAFAIASSVFVSTFCTLGYGVLEHGFRWAPRTRLQLGENPYFLITVQFFLYVLLWGFLFLLITRKYGRPFARSVGLRRLPSEQMRRFAWLGFGLALIVMLGSSLFPSMQRTPLERIFGEGRAIYLLGLFGILVAPFVEELIFRGFLFPIFEKLGGSRVAVLVTALIFSGLHVPQLWGSWPAITLIFLVGLVFSFIRARTGLLTPCWITHLMYNSTLVLAAITAQALSPMVHLTR